MKESLFIKLTNEFTQPIATWQHSKPAKRNAFLLFCDHEAERWTVRMFGNPRSKFHTATSLSGLHDAMMKFPELLDAMRAHVRCAERELRKEAKAKAQKEEDKSHGKG